MALSPEQKTRIFKAIGRMMAHYLRLVRRTSTTVIEPTDGVERAMAAHPFIFAMWHGQFLMMPTLQEGQFPVLAIIARHGDADIIGEILTRFSMQIVRGSGAAGRRTKAKRGGAVAMRTALRVLSQGTTFAMTADMFPGPPRHVGVGIATLAKLSGRPVIPFAAATSRFIVLPTWSRMTLNLPYSKLAFVVGEPISVPPDATDDAFETCRLAIENELNRVTARAYELAGGDIGRVAPRALPDPNAPPPAIGLRLRLYRGATRLLRLAAPAILAIRSRRGKEDPARMSERYGCASRPRPDGHLMWVHAASVGETNAIIPLIERMKSLRPDLHVLLTTGTTTSAALAARRLEGRAIHQFIPLDSPDYVARFLSHWRPSLAVFTESEIWPNLIIELEARSVPLALVNGRMSSRSLKRWRRSKSVARALFSRFSIVLAQNERLARVFKELGARRSLALGNLKVDAPPPPVDEEWLGQLRQSLGGRRVLVAASTHEGEEAIVAEAHRQIARSVPSHCTIIAPRHPERGAAVAEKLEALGLTVIRRSAGALPDAATDIYIVDSIGELGTLYALTDVAFVGGSLVPHGGQNPIEPIGHGAVVLTGPHYQNFRDFYSALLRLGGAREVNTAEELAAAAIGLLTSESELAAMRQGAKAALLTLSGALDQTAEALDELLPIAETARAS